MQSAVYRKPSAVSFSGRFRASQSSGPKAIKILLEASAMNCILDFFPGIPHLQELLFNGQQRLVRSNTSEEIYFFIKIRKRSRRRCRRWQFQDVMLDKDNPAGKGISISSRHDPLVAPPSIFRSSETDASATPAWLPSTTRTRSAATARSRAGQPSSSDHRMHTHTG